MNEISAVIFHGVIIAIGLILPLGVQNTFIFNQALTQISFWHCLPSILTAAICDTILITLAVLGISLIILKFIWLKFIILILGVFFLIFMGISIWNKKNTKATPDKPLSASKQILFTISFSLFNPHAIIDTIVVIGTSALAYSGKLKIIYAISCISVSWGWFFFLAFIGSHLRRKDKNGNILTSMNKIAALIMWAIAGYLIKDIFSILNLNNLIIKTLHINE